MKAAAPPSVPAVLSNAEIADRLMSLAQLLSTQKENPYKVQAYQRAAAKLRAMSESVDELVREDADLTQYGSIGKGISSAIREIVLTGTLARLEEMRSEATPELADISRHPRLDPRRVLRIYKKLGIRSVAELQQKFESGEIEQVLGSRMAQHVRQGLVETHAILLYKADDLRAEVERFLVDRCHVKRAEAVGDYRRRVEVIEELAFVVESDDFSGVVSKLERYGGRTPLVNSTANTALFALQSGILLRLQQATERRWGLALIGCTGSKAHVRKLAAVTGSLKALGKSGEAFPTEAALYSRFGLVPIAPELREGRDEVERAANATLPALVTVKDLRGELHAHSTSSDGANSIAQMASAARARGYQYIGITDHSQSLKIANGLPADGLWDQIRRIDRLNERLGDIRILKSAEVDILADGSLDYPDDLLKELDYTVCSIHSRFGLGKAAQTERIMRAMDKRHFTILGHPTGRLLLKRPGYEIDIDRVIEHAVQNGCFFEVNSSPDRLDLCADNARRAAAAGVKIAVSTDAHSTGEFGLVRYGVDQARRAGLEAGSILNTLTWEKLRLLFRR